MLDITKAETMHATGPGNILSLTHRVRQIPNAQAHILGGTAGWTLALAIASAVQVSEGSSMGGFGR